MRTKVFLQRQAIRQGLSQSLWKGEWAKRKTLGACRTREPVRLVLPCFEMPIHGGPHLVACCRHGCFERRGLQFFSGIA